MSRRRLLLGLMTMATAVLISLILTDWSPILRGPVPDTFVWHWNYRPRPLNRWWAALLAAIFIFLTAVWWLRQTENKRWVTAVTVTGLAVGSFLLQLGLIYADRQNPIMELVDRTLAVQTNGFYWTATQIENINATLRDYPAMMTTFESDHTRTHPPGLIIINWLTMAALEKAPYLSHHIASTIRPMRCTDLWLYSQPGHIAAALGIWAFIPLVLAAAAVYPTYLFARQLADNKTAILATSFMAVLPSLLVFAPLADQIYPFLTLLMLLVLQRGLSKQQTVWFFGVGMLLSVSSFLTLGNAALLFVIVIYAALDIWQKTNTPKIDQWLKWGLALVLGTVSIWLIYWIGWGVPPWEIAQAGMVEHYTLVTSKRSYQEWLFYNLVDLVIFVGLPIIIGFVSKGLTAVRNILTSHFTSSEALAVTVLAFIILLNFSGSTRGEVGRIWLFVMPLIVIVGAIFWADWSTNQATLRLVLGLQLLLSMSIGLSWGMVGATIVVAERPSNLPPPSELTPTSTRFGNTITLNGYTLNIQAETLNLTLVWQAAGAAERPYTVFNHLINSNGDLIAQQDNWPVNGLWPPSCWRSGEQITDSYTLNLPPDLPPGTYHLYTGLYDAADGTRLLTLDGNDAILLQPITID